MRFMHSILMVTNKDLSGVSEPFARAEHAADGRKCSRVLLRRAEDGLQETGPVFIDDFRLR